MLDVVVHRPVIVMLEMLCRCLTVAAIDFVLNDDSAGIGQAVGHQAADVEQGAG
jgi:hypothetical protein